MTCSCDRPGTCIHCTAMTVAEAAALCGVRPVTIRQWINRDHLEPRRVGRRTLVIEAELLACERARRHARAPARAVA